LSTEATYIGEMKALRLCHSNRTVSSKSSQTGTKTHSEKEWDKRLAIVIC